MRKLFSVVLMIGIATFAYGQEERLSKVHKDLDISGLFSRDGKIEDSIAVETLANIPSVILHAGQGYPDSARITFGISDDCQCAKFRLFRVPQDPTKPPIEISYDAIRGFSQDNRTVEVLFEITEKRKIRLSVEVSEQLEPGQLLEWGAVADIMKRIESEKADAV